MVDTHTCSSTDAQLSVHFHTMGTAQHQNKEGTAETQQFERSKRVMKSGQNESQQVTFIRHFQNNKIRRLTFSEA